MTAPPLSVEQRCRMARGVMDCLVRIGAGTPTLTVTEEGRVFLTMGLHKPKRVAEIEVTDTLATSVEEVS